MIRNRVVGIMVIGIAAMMGFIIYSFNAALTNIVNTSCSHGTSCPMWGTIDFQTNVSIAIMALVVVIGIYLIFFSREEKIITKEITKEVVRQQIETKKLTKENFRDVMKDMTNDEKLVLEKVLESEGTIFQSDLVEKSGLNKVKVTRILDKLEGRGVIERKRRGMTNVVIIKR